MEDSECVDEDDPCGLTNDEQHSTALTAPAPECPGKLAMYDKLIAVYFEKFHHHWPIVHEKSIRLRNAPQVLVKTVVTIGLYLTDNIEAQNMAKKTLEGFLHQSGNALVSLPPGGNEFSRCWSTRTRQLTSLDVWKVYSWVGLFLLIGS